MTGGIKIQKLRGRGKMKQQPNNTAVDPRDVLEKYFELVRRVDSLAQGIVIRNAERLACRPGCAHCCKQFSVLPVEAAVLRSAISALESLPEAKQDSCPLLTAEGLCAVYESRPLICRTHGLPISGRDVNGKVDCCPLNFRDVSLDSLGWGDVLDLDVLNSILIAVNSLYLKATGADPKSGERISIRDIVAGAT
jgi:hypothetical protein